MMLKTSWNSQFQVNNTGKPNHHFSGAIYLAWEGRNYQCFMLYYFFKSPLKARKFRKDKQKYIIIHL